MRGHVRPGFHFYFRIGIYRQQHPLAVFGQFHPVLARYFGFRRSDHNPGYGSFLVTRLQAVGHFQMVFLIQYHGADGFLHAVGKHTRQVYFRPFLFLRLESTGDRSITLYQMAFAVNRQGVVSDIA